MICNHRIILTITIYIRISLNVIKSTVLVIVICPKEGFRKAVFIETPFSLECIKDSISGCILSFHPSRLAHRIVKLNKGIYLVITCSIKAKTKAILSLIKKAHKIFHILFYYVIMSYHFTQFFSLVKPTIIIGNVIGIRIECFFYSCIFHIIYRILHLLYFIV